MYVNDDTTPMSRYLPLNHDHQSLMDSQESNGPPGFHSNRLQHHRRDMRPRPVQVCCHCRCSAPPDSFPHDSGVNGSPQWTHRIHIHHPMPIPILRRSCSRQHGAMLVAVVPFAVQFSPCSFRHAVFGPISNLNLKRVSSRRVGKRYLRVVVLRRVS